MKYYIDTEFLEGTQDKRLLGFKVGQTKPTIDLISIGIVAEDGREYYAISKDFNIKEAWNRHDIEIQQMYGDLRNQYPEGRRHKNYWIRDNVLKPIFKELWHEKCHMQNLHHVTNDFTYKNFKRLIEIYGKSNLQIAADIKEFVYTQYGYSCIDHINRHLYAKYITDKLDREIAEDPIEFYAYYADYDWVAFCWLFGKMIDLPTGFPMYCIDLKQMLDDCYMYQANKYEGITRLDAWLKDVKRYPQYPKQENEHNAIDDARWNKKLHNFIQSLKNNTADPIPVSDGVSNSNT